MNPSNEYSGLIFYRIDRFDLLAVQGTLKSILQHNNSKASTLWHLAFFMVQLSRTEFQKNIYFFFSDYAKAFFCVDYKKLENS